MVSEKTFCVENCPLEFQCNKRWFDLKGIEAEADVCYCGECEKPVFRVTNQIEYEKHAAMGHCVALDFGLANLTVGMLEMEIYNEMPKSITRRVLTPDEVKAYKTLNPDPTPEETRRARFSRDLDELQAGVRNGWKPATQALAELKAKHPDLWAEFNLQEDN